MEARCVDAAVPARLGVPRAGVDATVECLVLSDILSVSVSVSDLKLSKSRFEEDAFQNASARAKPRPLFPFLPDTVAPAFSHFVQLHNISRT